MEESTEPASLADRLTLADWRRQVAELYADVRAFATESPELAWRHWRDERERLFREHPQSPVPPARRHAFRSRTWPYDPELRWELAVERDTGQLAAAAPAAEGLPAADPATGPQTVSGGAGAFRGLGQLALPMSAGEALSFTPIGAITLPLPGGPRQLSVYWLAGYAGGLFVPFRDATSGQETYAAGRYLLDGAKSADLGGDPAAGRLVIDLNFAFQPSCAFDPRWACPLAPPDNWLDLPIRAGERLR